MTSAAALYKMIGDNFMALSESGITDTSTKVWGFSNIIKQFLAEDFDFRGTEEQKIGRAQLILALLHVQTNLLHATSGFGIQAIKLLKLFTINSTSDNPIFLQLIRQYYPSALVCLLFICRNELIELTPESIMTISKAIFILSETPMQDLDSLVSLLLNNNFGYFEAAFQVLNSLDGNDLRVYYVAVSTGSLMYPFLTTEQQDQWQLAISLMIREQKSLTMEQIALLNSLKAKYKL